MTDHTKMKTMRANDLGLKEDDLGDIVEYLDVYRMLDLPPDTEPQDLPVKTSSLEDVLSDMGFVLTEAEIINMAEKVMSH